MKYAITSVSGNLGREIAMAVCEVVGNENVVGLARTPSNVAGLDIEVRPGDYNEREQLQNSLQGVDRLLFVSGMDAPDKRIEQHRNVINAAKVVGVKKLVYTSVQGAESGTAFSPIIQSNRHTEQDVRDSGLEWSIGRNGIYIEPDVEYIEDYKKQGEVVNCAGDGKCGYTSRPELGYAYARMLTEDQHNGRTYNLHGERITQRQLADYLNRAFGTDLKYRAVTFEEYKADRIAELGDFLGTVIAGIYQGIHLGALDHESHFREAAGREHQSWDDYFDELASSN